MSRRPHVMFLDSVAQLSGGELALLRTLPPLLLKIDATVVLAQDGPLAPRLRALGATVIVLPLDEGVRGASRGSVDLRAASPRTMYLLGRYVLRLRRLMRSLDPDLIHTNSLKSALYGGLAGRLARKPVVWHVRDRIAPDYLPVVAVRLVRLLARILPTAVIANSRTTLGTIRAGASSVIHSPVVFDGVTPVGGEVTPHGGPLVVGIVGRLSQWKGQDVFLRAFARAFGGSGVRARLIGSAMFGEDGFEQHLHALVEELGIAGQVEFRGFRDDVVEELRALDIAVHASTLPEPFGQVVLEAMAAGTPVIASAEGGPAEIVTHEVDGLLVPPRDPVALAEAMTRLSDDADERWSLAKAGRETARRYSPEATAAGILEVYRQVLGPTQARP